MVEQRDVTTVQVSKFTTICPGKYSGRSVEREATKRGR